MAVENIAVTYVGTIAAEIGIVVNTAGLITIGVNAGNPNEVNKLLTVLDAARQVVVNTYSQANNPAVANLAMRGATGF